MLHIHTQLIFQTPFSTNCTYVYKINEHITTQYSLISGWNNMELNWDVTNTWHCSYPGFTKFWKSLVNLLFFCGDLRQQSRHMSSTCACWGVDVGGLPLRRSNSVDSTVVCEKRFRKVTSFHCVIMPHFCILVSDWRKTFSDICRNKGVKPYFLDSWAKRHECWRSFIVVIWRWYQLCWNIILWICSTTFWKLSLVVILRIH